MNLSPLIHLIDDASPENIRKLKNFFEMTLEENRKPFDELCQLLVQNYEWKDNTPPPEPDAHNNDGGLKRRIYKKP